MGGNVQCGDRLHLYKKWLQVYEDLKSALNMLALNNLTKILPRLAATHIKDKTPEIVKKLKKLRMLYIYEVRRWSYSNTFPKRSTHQFKDSSNYGHPY